MSIKIYRKNCIRGVIDLLERVDREGPSVLDNFALVDQGQGPSPDLTDGQQADGRTEDVSAQKEVTAKKVLKLVSWLKSEFKFTYARRLLVQARIYLKDGVTDDQRRKLRQQHALCTYKDLDMATEAGLREAMQILESDESEDLATTANEETLGIAGAIYKRWWDVDSRKQHLDQALFYYEQGFMIFCDRNKVTYEGGKSDRIVISMNNGDDNNNNDDNKNDDNGYTGINAAFILDLLADSEKRSDQGGHKKVESIKKLRDRADSIRKILIKVLTQNIEECESNKAPSDTEQDLKNQQDQQDQQDQSQKYKKSRQSHSSQTREMDWWLIATIAEAFFGLGKGYENEAKRWILRAKEENPEMDWKVESFARQLATIARIRDGISPKEPDFIDREPVKLIRILLNEAESGLTSLFIGKVGLALSGGGFRASLFHLGVLARLAECDLLRHIEVISCVSGGSIVGTHYYLALQRELEQKLVLSREDYIKIVEEVITTFVAGVKTNIRSRALLNPFNRTERIARLLEEKFYSKITSMCSPLRLSDLIIKPPNSRNFHPLHHNWCRDAKVPILILNATTLNTGHNWQFTATYMGEPPAYIEDEIDTNCRLRRMYNEHEAPPGYKGGVQLGRAVAASACLPAVFPPMILRGLYPNKSVRLVDGGVRENQGIFGLIQQNCDVIIVSDGSGQMEDIDRPSSLPTSVPFRAIDITMQTIRSAFYKQLVVRSRVSRLRHHLYLHLKKGLNAQTVDWGKGKSPSDPGHIDQGDTDYGVSRKVQHLLSNLRTDLDKFSENEMYALMLNGYKMADKELASAIPDVPLNKELYSKWPFMKMKEYISHTSLGHDQLVKELKVGKYRTLRWLRRWF